MTPRRWIALVLVGAAVTIGVGAISPSIGSAIGAGMLTATFVAILWYTFETRRLVDVQERAGEFDRHPWLKATDLAPTEIAPGADQGSPFGGSHIWLPITNMGRTPALDLVVSTKLKVSDPDNRKQLEAGERSEGQTLVPGDVLHIEIGRVLFDGPKTEIEIAVTVEYRVSDGGRGQVNVGFRYTSAKGWRNLPTRYQFWLSDGSQFPR